MKFNWSFLLILSEKNNAKFCFRQLPLLSWFFSSFYELMQFPAFSWVLSLWLAGWLVVSRVCLLSRVSVSVRCTHGAQLQLKAGPHAYAPTSREVSVVRLSVRLSVNFAQIATSTTNMTGSSPNLQNLVPTRACIRGVLKVKVKGHVIRTLFWFHENHFFYHKQDWIATKLAHDGPHIGLHPGSAQGQGQRSRDTGTSVCHEMFAIQYLLTVCLYMHSLYEAPLHSPSTTSVRQLDVMSTSWNELLRYWRRIDGLVSSI